MNIFDFFIDSRRLRGRSDLTQTSHPSFIQGFTFNTRLKRCGRGRDPSLLHLSSAVVHQFFLRHSRPHPSFAPSLLPPAAVAAASAPPLLFLASAGFLHHVGRRLGVGHAVRVAGVVAESRRVGDDGGGVVRRADLGPGDDDLAVGVIKGHVDGGHGVGRS